MKIGQSKRSLIFRGKFVRSLAGVGLFVAILLVSVKIGQANTLSQTAQEGQDIFQQRCATCHTIGGGKLVGPDLQDVTTRRDLAWLKEFIATPDKMLAAGDPLAKELLAEYNNVPMPNLSLSSNEVDALIVYLEGAVPAEIVPKATANVIPGDAGRGEKYFNGKLALTNGGTSCIACHHVSGVGVLGGGALGPDLTQVHTRYGGDAGLGSVLLTLPFPSMQSSFANKPLTPEEQADLLAYFGQTAKQTATSPPTGLAFLFLGVGVVGALVLFGIMAFSWPTQRKSLSDRLREKA